ncbi:MAG: oxidoreductase [Bradyrhizobiaceae bacterium]|nr:MAG: oxidoreductase [Bradyrhizobiaceae bacterium]
MTARMIMKLQVAQARLTTPDVLHLRLVHPLRPNLPEWSAGAHVDLRLPDGRVRQYSLCGNPDDLSAYEIAVKRETNGRGGSIWAHDHLTEGATAHVSAPRNNLPLVDAKRIVIVAGGIGITPFVSMVRTLMKQGRDFTLHYCARSASEAPLLDELKDICGPSLQCWFSQEGSRFDPAVIGPSDPDTHVYVCGPQRLLDAVQSALADWPEDHVHTEVFQLTLDENFKAEPFEATIASTGQRLHVRADQSLLEVLRNAGFIVASSCELGVCGSCECGYLDGIVIHRDKSLPVSKRQDRMLPCVSRARVAVTLDM